MINPDKRMAFLEHFDELRVRLMRMLYAFMVAFVGGYLVSERVMEWLRAPLFAILPAEKQHLYYTSLFENFLTHLKIAGYLGLFILAPYFFYEIWQFVAPGLKPKERKMILPFVGGATFFFVVGSLFAYFVLFPAAFKFFVTYGGPSDVALLTIGEYYSTCLKLMLLFGLGFELPVIVCLFGALGLVDAVFLKKQRKTAIIVITTMSALFAPPDAMSMLLLMIPLILLYEGSIWIVAWMGARRVPPPSTEPQDPLKGASNY